MQISVAKKQAYPLIQLFERFGRQVCPLISCVKDVVLVGVMKIPVVRIGAFYNIFVSPFLNGVSGRTTITFGPVAYALLVHAPAACGSTPINTVKCV